MENVPGMLTSKVTVGKNNNVVVVPQLVKEAFEKINYECEIKPLWANDYGVPQTRQRVIFLGWKKSNPDDRIEHPIRQVERDITSIEAIEDLLLLDRMVEIIRCMIAILIHQQTIIKKI